MPDFHSRVGKQGNLICMPVLYKIKNIPYKGQGFCLVFSIGQNLAQGTESSNKSYEKHTPSFCFFSINAFISFLGDVKYLSSAEFAVISINHTFQGKEIA